MLAHKAKLYEKIQDIVFIETGGKGNPELAEQVLILYEGATATAIYHGAQAIASARAAETHFSGHMADRLLHLIQHDDMLPKEKRHLFILGMPADQR